MSREGGDLWKRGWLSVGSQQEKQPLFYNCREPKSVGGPNEQAVGSLLELPGGNRPCDFVIFRMLCNGIS